ncbi:hypothetical protein [Chamaesiphon sp. GL140_3_metabinner_50]|nr:hypothetical protein [Chamaesiphon sp. GL140_3_metabinner_50]
MAQPIAIKIVVRLLVEILAGTYCRFSRPRHPQIILDKFTLVCYDGSL